MKTRKNERANLDTKRNFFLLIGLTFSLGATLMAFEWKTDAKPLEKFTANWGAEEVELIPITRVVEPPKPKVKIAVVTQFEIIDEKEEDLDIPDLDFLESEYTEDAIPECPMDEEIDESELIPWATIQNKPEFKGGEEALMNFLPNNTKYPQISKENDSQGVVYIEFIVAKNGKIINAKIKRGVDEYIDKEALRVVNLMPKWKPGSQRGKTVNVSYILPFRFKLFE